MLRIGPLAMVRMAAGVWILVCVFAFFSKTIPEAVVCKVVKGLSMGCVSICVPMYLFEVLLPSQRAMGIGALGLGSFFGQKIMVCFALILLRFFDPAQAFHYVGFGEAGLGAIVLVLSFLLPELPASLCRRDRWFKASKNLKKLSKNRGEIIISEELAFPLRLSQIFTSHTAFLVARAMAVQIFSLLISVSVNQNYSRYLSAFCGLNDASAMGALITQYAVMLVFSCSTIYLLRRARRKDNLAIGTFLLFVLYGILAGVSKFCVTSSPSTVTYGPDFAIRDLAATIVLATGGATVAVASALTTSTALLYSMEILPHCARAYGVAIAMFAAWSVSAAIEGTIQFTTRVNPFIIFIALSGVSLLATVLLILCKESREIVKDEGIPYDLPRLLDNKVSPFFDGNSPPLITEKTTLQSALKKIPSVKSLNRNTSLRRVSIEKPLGKVLVTGASTPMYTANSQLHANIVESKNAARFPSSTWLEPISFLK